MVKLTDLAQSDFVCFGPGAIGNCRRQMFPLMGLLIDQYLPIWISRRPDDYESKTEFITTHVLRHISVAYYCDKSGAVRTMEMEEVVEKLSQKLRVPNNGRRGCEYQGRTESTNTKRSFTEMNVTPVSIEDEPHGSDKSTAEARKFSSFLQSYLNGKNNFNFVTKSKEARDDDAWLDELVHNISDDDVETTDRLYGTNSIPADFETVTVTTKDPNRTKLGVDVSAQSTKQSGHEYLSLNHWELECDSTVLNKKQKMFDEDSTLSIEDLFPLYDHDVVNV